MYAESTNDVKRRPLDAIIEEVRCTVKRGEKTREIEFRLRGNGSIKKEWEEAKKANGESGNLPSGSSTPHVVRLPVTHENSNFILLRIPVEISNSARGEKAIVVAEGPLHSSLPLSPAAITRLHDVRLIHRPRPVRAKRLPIDYGDLQQTYRRMLAEGTFSSQADLARHLGGSRDWVSSVLRGTRRKAD